MLECHISSRFGYCSLTLALDCRQPPGDVCLAQRLALHWAVKAHPYARPYLAKAFLELQKATLDVKPSEDVGHEEEWFRSTLIS